MIAVLAQCLVTLTILGFLFRVLGGRFPPNINAPVIKNHSFSSSSGNQQRSGGGGSGGGAKNRQEEVDNNDVVMSEEYRRVANVLRNFVPPPLPSASPPYYIIGTRTLGKRVSKHLPKFLTNIFSSTSQVVFYLCVLSVIAEAGNYMPSLVVLLGLIGLWALAIQYQDRLASRVN